MKSNATKTEHLPLALTVSEIAEVLGLSKANAYELCKSKGFPCVHIGKRMIIPKPAFERWLENPPKQ